MIPHLFKKPWLHFVLIGFALYILKLQVDSGQLAEIELPSEEKVAELRGQWLRTTGIPPSEQQVQQLVNNEINQEILFQEALRYHWHLDDPVVRQRLIQDVRFLDPDNNSDDDALFQQALDLQLHLNDLVVRRRLIQRMEMMAFAPTRQGPVDELALQKIYEDNLQDYVQPPRIDFRHVFVSRDKHEHPLELARQRKQLLAAADRESIYSMSDPFMHGYEFKGLTQAQLARYFGADFAKELFIQAAGDDSRQQWLGPLASSYGQHLVWLDQLEPARQKSFADVRKQILAQWRRQQEQLALQRLIKQLRSEYGFDAA